MRGINVLLALAVILGVMGCRTTGRRDNPVYVVTVDKGDTLASIAQRFNTSWQEIVRDNRLRDARDFRVGQKLQIHPGPGGYLADSGRTFGDDTNGEENSNSQARPDSMRRKSGGGFLFGGGNEAEDNEDNNGASNGRRRVWTPLPWPVSGSVSSEYGYRWGRLHAGIDIRAPRGTPILSPASGKVIFAGRKGDYGKFILIDHGTFKTAYGHCASIDVSQGDVIKKGAVIGEVGSSGNASGTHLHFEFRMADDKPVDPVYYLAPRSLLSSATVASDSGS